MFEQSILQPETDKKRWTFAASIAVEVCVVSVSLLIPLIYTERLGLGKISAAFVPMAPRALPAVVSQPQTSRTPTHSVNRWDWRPSLNAPLNNVPVISTSLESGDPCPGCVVDGVPSDRYTNVIGIGTVTVLPPPKPPQAKPAEVKKPVDPPPAPITVSKGAQEAKIIRRIIPTYPALAKQARVQGLVKLLGVISTEGRIEKLQVISGHPLLVQAAVDAVKQWTYRPTLLNGQPVEVMAPIDVNFILSN